MKLLLKNLLLICFITFVVSCEKGQEVGSDNEFVGKWTTNRTVVGMNLKETLILTENSFDKLVNLKLIPMVYIDLMGAKGSLDFTSSTFLLNI